MPARTPRRGIGRQRLTLALAASAATMACAGGVALAGSGGVGVPDEPEVDDVVCATGCGDGLREVAVGGTVVLTGSNFEDVTRVKFTPASGDDRIPSPATNVTESSATATVPEGAATGKPRAETASGIGDRSPNELVIVPGDEVEPAGSFQLVPSQTSVTPNEVYYYGSEKATLTYMFQGEQQDLRIEVIERGGGAVWSTIVDDVPPATPQTLTWNGKKDGGGKASSGEYKVKIGPRSGGGDDGDGATDFEFYDHKFPVRGPHDYWDGFGAGRGHQGQDVGAACGTNLEAARGGKVQTKAYHGAAGYYVVIDGKGTKRDYVYMHMKRKRRPDAGERVKTGERIGDVSDTGNASGCHLHFELWSGPGWYQGGHPKSSVTKHLKRWDSWS